MRRALGLWDRSDATFALADAATDSREAAKLARLAIQLADAALKAWKVLKFPTPEGVRRPGRPSGDDWSEARKVAAAAREQRF
jgi:hypothetical protein